MISEPMPFEAELRISVRASRLSVRVQPGGRAVVTVPQGISYGSVLRFMRRHKDWVARTSETMRRFRPVATRADARRAYLAHKEAARRFAYAAIARFAPFYGVAAKAVSIRDQRTRWGSCSRDGRLSFNYRLAILPPRLAEYVVVHELCHMLEFNHSPRFWALVARTVPEHRTLRKALHEYHPSHA
jgi:predicted metal-dependent hydrolase